MITLKQLEKIMKEEEITIQDLNNDREYIEILYRFLNDNNLKIGRAHV